MILPNILRQANKKFYDKIICKLRRLMLDIWGHLDENQGLYKNNLTFFIRLL